MEHDPGTTEAVRLIEDVAREALQDGRARIEVRQSPEYPSQFTIDLIPANARACQVSVSADTPPQIDMWLGPEPTTAWYEFWDDWSVNLARLRERLEAVLAGRSEQTVETRKRNSILITGRFDLPGGEETFSQATRATGAVKSGETYILRFEPY